MGGLCRAGRAAPPDERLSGLHGRGHGVLTRKSDLPFGSQFTPAQTPLPLARAGHECRADVTCPSLVKL